MNYANDRLTYRVDDFPFVESVLLELNRSLANDGIDGIGELAAIHTIDGIASRLESFRQLFFTHFRGRDFQSIYRRFGAWLIDEYFTPDAIIQKTPTIRIHLDKGKSVSFHSDAWYGHGRRVCSFWLPLTPVFETNSLQMARSLDESRQFLSGIEDAQLDLDEINLLAANLCDPVDACPGDLIVFNADMVHGTVDNRTGRSRVSFDFRIAESIHEIGTKPGNNFFTRDDLKFQGDLAESAASPARPRRSAYMYSGLCRGVSAKSQLIFLNEYARLQDINIIGSESEIVCFDYCLVLQKYVKNPPAEMDTLLLFSVDLLPSDPDIRHRIYSNAIKSGISIVCGAEDFAIKDESGIARAESILENSHAVELIRVA